MPLRDHFRPPVSTKHSWEGFHAGWPMVIVQHLQERLPEGYVAEPRVHLGTQVEIDIAAFEGDDQPQPPYGGDGGGGIAVATAVAWAPAAPAVAVETELPDPAEYEVRVYDLARERQLVAAVEIVSPANKDRPEHRNAFVGKCAALLQKGVAVSIVDLVTVRQFNLYEEVMGFLGRPARPAPGVGAEPPHTYAVSCRWVSGQKKALFQAWPHLLTVGGPLPTLPLWLAPGLAVPLELEASYEKACRDLRVA